jgi:hypothetical protein
MRRTVTPGDRRPVPDEREPPDRAAPGLRAARLAGVPLDRTEPLGETTGRSSISCSRAQMGQF